MNNPSKTPLIDLLRRIPRDAWGEITHPNGWSYSTNIGKLVNDAADEIERLRIWNFATALIIGSVSFILGVIVEVWLLKF